MAPRWLDRFLLLLLVAVAFLLGCYEMGDSDIWWHLRGGQWILEHGHVPGLDPFTFGSADRLWIDIHWSYEVVLALVYRAGGVGALVLLGATFGTGAFLACLTAWRRGWPIAVGVLCWLPALVLFAFRLDPRPEIFSLLYLGCYLAVLWRAEQRPAWIWLLPPLQILWVNAQGLFVLGPVLLGLFVAAHGARLPWRWLTEGARPEQGRHWWLHVGGAALTVGAACLVNPYFIQGARFPFDLFPKVSDPNNIYKRYIDELMSPAVFVHEATPAVAGRNWFFLAFFFLLLLLPVSFLYPALWRTWRSVPPVIQRRSRKQARSRPRAEAESAKEISAVGGWLIGLAVIVVLLAARTLTLSGWGNVGGWLPLVFLLAGAAAIRPLWRYSPEVAMLAFLSGATLAAWMAWLEAALLRQDGSAHYLAVPLVLAGLAAGILVLRQGGDLFRGLLAGAFAYLALQALQNWTRFALVAGAILAWNFGEWVGRMSEGWAPGRARTVAGWCLRGGLAAVLGLWLAALASDRFFVHTGEPRHFAFREEPLAFAHDAAEFAARPGLPDRALVYGLDQASVYTFHNAPHSKPFLDGRLEMPAQKTFETYVEIEDWLRSNNPRWQQALADMGLPLVLLDHRNNHHSEAILLTHPAWHCVYFDALASIFVHRDANSSEADFSAVDFADRHFRQPDACSIPAVRGAAYREGKALGYLAESLPRTPEAIRSWRIPALWCALDRGRLALEEDPTRPEVWVTLGRAYLWLNPTLGLKRPVLTAAWVPEEGMSWAQATYCFRQALRHKSDDAPAWRELFRSYRARGLDHAALEAGEHWLQLDPKIPAPERERIQALRRQLKESPLPRLPDALRDGGDVPRPWPLAEQAAGLAMHLGRPADARHIWEQATSCPSEALRYCRLASTFWVERDFATALQHLQKAREDDPRLAEACWALAVLHAQLGDAGPALEACREGLELALSDRQRSDLEGLQRILLALPSRP
jgi:tetratricopeptide (TPR) repeat protein